MVSEWLAVNVGATVGRGEGWSVGRNEGNEDGKGLGNEEGRGDGFVVGCGEGTAAVGIVDSCREDTYEGVSKVADAS